MIPTTSDKKSGPSHSIDVKIAQYSIKLIGNGYREHNSYQLYKFNIWIKCTMLNSYHAKFFIKTTFK